MKKLWSPKWKGSNQPRKQRKFRINAPMHIRRKFVSAHLSKILRKQYGFRSIPLRKGDEVKVVRGEFKGRISKVSSIDLDKHRIYLDGLKVKKSSGQEVDVSLEPSNVVITSLELGDKERTAIIKRRRKISGEA